MCKIFQDKHKLNSVVKNNFQITWYDFLFSFYITILQMWSWSFSGVHELRGNLQTLISFPAVIQELIL